VIDSIIANFAQPVINDYLMLIGIRQVLGGFPGPLHRAGIQSVDLWYLLLHPPRNSLSLSVAFFGQTKVQVVA
jgi:hypothetical protein